MPHPSRKPTTRKLHRYSALMYGTVAVLSLSAMVAMVSLKPVASTTIKGNSQTAVLPTIDVLIDDCYGSYAGCHSTPRLTEVADKQLTHQIDGLAKQTDISPVLLAALAAAAGNQTDLRSIDAGTIESVANLYSTIRENNRDNQIPSVYTNRHGSYQLTDVNRTTYYCLLTLSHLINDKNRFNGLILPSPDDGATNSLSEILSSLTQ